MTTTTAPAHWGATWASDKHAERVARGLADETAAAEAAADRAAYDRHAPGWWTGLQAAFGEIRVAIAAELPLQTHPEETALHVLADPGSVQRRSIVLAFDARDRSVRVEVQGPTRDVSVATLAVDEAGLVATWRGTTHPTPAALARAIAEPWLDAVWREKHA
jgi:hypothetical protein